MMNVWYDAYANGYAGHEDADYEPGFANDSMIEQLNKVIDAGNIVPGVDLPEKKYKPHTTVVTDDGDTITLSIDEAKSMRDLVLNINVKERLEVLKAIQTTKGLTSVLDYIKIGK